MKKIAVILLLLIYGSATMGATLHLHYCMNELVGWSLWDNGTEECGRCGMVEDKTGCCKDEHKHFKLKAEHHKAPAAELISFNFTPVIIDPIPQYKYQDFVRITESYSPCHAPPDIGKLTLYVLNCTFMI